MPSAFASRCSLLLPILIQELPGGFGQSSGVAQSIVGGRVVFVVEQLFIQTLRVTGGGLFEAQVRGGGGALGNLLGGVCLIEGYAGLGEQIL